MAIENTLIDTDIAIDYLRGLSDVQGVIETLWREGKAYLSVLSVYELFAGMRPEEKQATTAFIEACYIEDVNREVAEEAGELRRQYKDRGITVSSIDCLIAATAQVRGHKILTRNKRHFPEDLLSSI